MRSDNCDNCGAEDLPKGTRLYGCTECDYDVCQKCWDEVRGGPDGDSPRKMSFEQEPTEKLVLDVEKGGKKNKKKNKKKDTKKDKKGGENGLSKEEKKAAKAEAKADMKETKRRNKLERRGIEVFDNPVNDPNHWPTDKRGVLKIDKRKGVEMVEQIVELYLHLRATSVQNTTVRDTFGLWLHIDDSEDEDNEEDAEDFEDGDVTFDATHHEAVLSAKKIKHAMRVNNPDKMNPVEITEALTKRGLSVKGDAEHQLQRFKDSLLDEAKRMTNVTAVVLHFNSQATQRNLEMLVSKINQRSHTDVQDKLKTAHADIRKLEKLHKVVRTPAIPTTTRVPGMPPKDCSVFVRLRRSRV